MHSTDACCYGKSRSRHLSDTLSTTSTPHPSPTTDLYKICTVNVDTQSHARNLLAYTYREIYTDLSKTKQWLGSPLVAMVEESHQRETPPLKNATPTVTLQLNGRSTEPDAVSQETRHSHKIWRQQIRRPIFSDVNLPCRVHDILDNETLIGRRVHATWRCVVLSTDRKTKSMKPDIVGKEATL